MTSTLTLLGAGMIYSVIKRPAGTSILEASVYVGGFGATLMTMLPASRARTVTVWSFGVAFETASTLLFPWSAQYHVIAASK